jgi:DinB superfamily
MTRNDPLRELLARLLDWEDAHIGFDAAVANVPAALRGTAPDGLPYSPWQLLEHLRLAQQDILDFCINPRYTERRWPDDYWPHSAVPPPGTAWDESIRKFREDRAALQRLTLDPSIDLTARIPHGQGQTYGREVVLAADHAAYHVGQLIAVRRLLGCWP